MAKKILHVVESAYRATIEEQDDTVVWVTHAMKGGGADLTVLLRGNAVNYAVRGQDAAGLMFGKRRQTQPPRLDDDLARLAAKGAKVFIIEDDLRERGIERGEVIEGPELIARGNLAQLVASHDLVFHW